MKQIRATARAIAALAGFPLFIGALAVQKYIVDPLTGNQTVIPKFLCKVLGLTIGLRVEFNKASAPVVKDKPVWFVANHMSNADFLVLGSQFDGTFVGKGDVLKWPGVAQVARAVRFIGVRRSAEFNEQSRAKIIKNFNDGYNTIMFPEGTISDGKEVHLFRAPLITLLYGEKGVDKQQNEVKLEKDVLLQPVAIRVKSVNGQNAVGNDSLRNMYSMFSEGNLLTELWKRMQIRNVTVEVTALPALDPRGFKDAKELINKAALDIASVVNPGQTVFEKIQIPNQPQKTAVPASPAL